jgi:hypothetical protein
VRRAQALAAAVSNAGAQAAATLQQKLPRQHHRPAEAADESGSTVLAHQRCWRRSLRSAASRRWQVCFACCQHGSAGRQANHGGGLLAVVLAGIASRPGRHCEQARQALRVLQHCAASLQCRAAGGTSHARASRRRSIRTRIETVLLDCSSSAVVARLRQLGSRAPRDGAASSWTSYARGVGQRQYCAASLSMLLTADRRGHGRN